MVSALCIIFRAVCGQWGDAVGGLPPFPPGGFSRIDMEERERVAASAEERTET